MPRGRYQQKQWDEREAAILAALESLSAERGFSNVTMDDVANEVGISKATLYQHFASKESMLVHLIAGQEDEFLAWVEESRDQPPLLRLRAIMQRMVEGHISPLSGVVNMGREEVLPVFRQNEDLISRHDQIISTLTAIIQQGQADGQIAPDLDPMIILSAMIALCRVSIDSGEGTVAARHPIPGNQTDQMILLFERGIRPV